MNKIKDNIKNSFLRVKKHIKLLEDEIRSNREFIIKQNKQILFLLEKIKRNEDSKTSNKAEFKENRPSSSGNEGVYSFIHSFTIHSLDKHSTDNSYSFIQQTKDKEESNQEEDIIIKENKMIKEEDIELERESIDFNPKRIENKENHEKIDIDLLNNNQIIKQKKQYKTLKFQGLRKEIEDLFENLSKQELLTFLTIYQLEEDKINVTYSHIANKLNLSEGCIRTYVSSLIKKGAPIIKKKYNNKLILLKVSSDFRALNLKKQLMAIYYRSDPLQPTLKETF